MCNEKQREIRFRGKRVDNGEWAEGYYIEAHYHWHNHGVHKEWIVSAACANGGWFTIYGRNPVIAGTVGQYTGLTDKTGKKVFEGDIIKGENILHTDRVVHRVVYSENGFHFLDEDGVDWHPDYVPLYEVIGNIHDTPELFEEAQHAE